MSSLETWPLELDFALESKDGVVLRCHKALLIKNSEYFEAIFCHKVRETDESKMVVPDYDGVTVASFLEWVYAAELGEEIVRKLKQVMTDLSLFPTHGGLLIDTFLPHSWKAKGNLVSFSFLDI